jgi:hypothetical protein
MSYKEDGDKLFPIVNDEFVDGSADFVDTWKAMEKLVESGRVKSIGVSNFNKRQIEKILANCKYFSFLKIGSNFLVLLDFLNYAKFYGLRSNQASCQSSRVPSISQPKAP